VTTQLTLKRADNHEIDTRDGSDFEDSRLARYTMAYSYPGDPSQQFPPAHRINRPASEYSTQNIISIQIARPPTRGVSTYLPADCVAAMMRDGWQLTT